jgi:O-antigen/teichoic acid export membrane protein
MTVQRPSTTALRRPSPTRHAAQLFTRLISRVREQLRTPLYSNVYALTLNTVVTSLVGMGYWVLAARLYSPAELGAGAAIVATMTFLSNLAQLNLNGALARFLPAAGRHGGRLIAYAYGASSCVAVLLASGFLFLAPLVSRQAQLPSTAPLLGVAFVVSVVAWSVFTLQDAVLTAVRGAMWVPVKNTAFSVAKIIVLIVLAAVVPSLGIFLSWNIAVLLVLLPVNLLLFKTLLPRLYQRPQVTMLPERAVLVRFVTLDYVGFLFLQAGTNALPVLVTAVLGAEANGVFYVGWLLGTSMELVAYHFATSLTVESSAEPSQLAANVRQILLRGLALFTLGAVLICVTTPLLLTVFGSEYVEGSSTVVRLFAIAVVPKFVVAMFVAACRVQHKVGRIVLTQASTTAIIVPVAVLTMRSIGVVSVAITYLVAQVVVAAAVMPTLIRLARSRA